MSCDESWIFLMDVLQYNDDNPFYPELVDHVYLLFYHERVLNQMLFLCLSRWQVVSVLHYINTFFPITEVECWSNTAILGKILHSPFQMFLDLVCWYCAEGVCIIILDKYGSVAFWWCQVWLWYWGDIVLIGWVRKCSLLSIQEESVKDGCYFFFKHLIGFTNETRGPRTSLCGKVFKWMVQYRCLLQVHSDLLFGHCI